VAVDAGGGDLDPTAALGGQRHDHRVIPDPLDRARLGRTGVSGQPVDAVMLAFVAGMRHHPQRVIPAHRREAEGFERCPMLALARRLGGP
jgi:hypothetical protein